jgi:hypothetical protein
MKSQMKPPFYGLMAQFASPEDLIHAAEAARKEGYRKMDGYSPFPIEELWEALGHHRNELPFLVLMGGIAGGLGGYALQYFTSVVDYPLNIGGRPFHSWPAFIPVTFEMTILFAAFAAVFGMLAFNGLPKPYHPVFNIEEFEHASRDGFFLCIEARDAKFDAGSTRRFLEGVKSQKVFVVEH